MAELRVESNTPRLLEPGQEPPGATVDQLPPEVPQRYWTSDKAAQVVARIGAAGSKFYGPSFKAAPWELDLIGDPAAAVMNDWLPLRVGDTGDKQANLIALVVVVFILVLLRLPDILEVHGIIKPYRAPGERQREPEPPRQAPAVQQRPVVVDTSPPNVPDDPKRVAYDEQLVGGGSTSARSDEKLREEIYGGGTVGGSTFAEMNT